MGEIEVKLLMTFSTKSGKKVSLYVTDPGEDLQAPVEAKVVQTETTEYDLVVA